MEDEMPVRTTEDDLFMGKLSPERSAAETQLSGE